MSETLVYLTEAALAALPDQIEGIELALGKGILAQELSLNNGWLQVRVAPPDGDKDDHHNLVVLDFPTTSVAAMHYPRRK
ncbi:hypothetical protein K8O92_33470 (plasmid) [Nocardia asteroides]|nr:hypothetical protein K8O92_33470 [Nocardia asteroides]